MSACNKYIDPDIFPHVGESTVKQKGGVWRSKRSPEEETK